jgi:dUTP pyrophosphatase
MNTLQEIQITLHDNALMPTRATAESAGYDLYVPQDTVITHGRQILPLGISIQLPKGYCAHVQARSGFSARGIEGHEAVDRNDLQQGTNLSRLLAKTKDLFFAQRAQRYNADVITGLIDSDYRGIIGAIIHSNSFQPFLIKRGTRIAQLVIMRHESPSITIVQHLSDTERGNGGFGSTND